MAHNNTVIAQFMKLIPRHEFESLAKQHHSGRSFRKVSRWDQLISQGQSKNTVVFGSILGGYHTAIVDLKLNKWGQSKNTVVFGDVLGGGYTLGVGLKCALFMDEYDAQKTQAVPCWCSSACRSKG